MHNSARRLSFVKNAKFFALNSNAGPNTCKALENNYSLPVKAIENEGAKFLKFYGLSPNEVREVIQRCLGVTSQLDVGCHMSRDQQLEYFDKKAHQMHLYQVETVKLQRMCNNNIGSREIDNCLIPFFDEKKEGQDQ